MMTQHGPEQAPDHAAAYKGFAKLILTCVVILAVTFGLIKLLALVL
jgi:hypothetical protein